MTQLVFAGLAITKTFTLRLEYFSMASPYTVLSEKTQKNVGVKHVLS
jgi:hypothetical protein